MASRDNAFPGAVPKGGDRARTQAFGSASALVDTCTGIATRTVHSGLQIGPA